MAECLSLVNARDQWCREKLEFVCAVVDDVDRESLKAQLENCETDEDAEGLMHSLLWLQDHNNAQITISDQDEPPRNQEQQEDHRNDLPENPQQTDHTEDLHLELIFGNDHTEHPLQEEDLDYDLPHTSQQQTVAQFVLSQDTPRQYPRLPAQDPDDPELWDQEDDGEHLNDQNHSLLHPQIPIKRLKLPQDREDDNVQDEDGADAVNILPDTVVWESLKDQQVTELVWDDDSQSEDTSGDELLARQLAELEEERQETEEDKVAAHLAILINIFPDAEPEYLEERCVVVRGEEAAFESLVEELLQTTTEPKMTGYLKRQREVALSHRSSSSTSPEENLPEPLLDPAQDVTANELHECVICFEDQVLEMNMATCNAYYNYHKFCIDCIRKHVAALIGQGHSSFKCMNAYCESEFSWRTLKRVMEPVVFQKIQERKQQDEILRAGIENLESCPFCNFMIIMPNQENKVLECLNPECLKESCRLCREQSHVPLRCEEIERDHQKDARVDMENQMAEAMIRECPQCKKRFIKEAGCNKMTCACGTSMCYLCKTVITNDYQHFEKQQVASNKCSLWSDSSELHTSEVREAAVRARERLDPGIRLVHDPSASVL